MHLPGRAARDEHRVVHLFGRSLIAVGLAMVVVGFLGTLLQVGRRIAAAAHPAGRARAA